ncbi:MAG TPA: alpha/beta hydrolase [Acidimicrobiales bacterium]|nr:alpha/beta hydrolase [Acidimicrobiales bacterium]
MDHYSVQGSGEPVVLLHGGLSDRSAWMFQIPVLAESFRVFAFDRRGHGTSPDTDAPFSYEEMADETAAFLEDVVGGPAHLVGWSDGGIVALLVSLRRPDLVRRQVLMGANFDVDGLLPGFDTGDDPDAESVAMIKVVYEGVAPDPGHWPEFYAKGNALFRAAPHVPASDLETVTAPTLVLAGDDDCIHHAHTVELFERIPDAQLAIVPGTSHFLFMEKPALVNQLITDFLTETAPPATVFPMRRG